GYDSLMRSVRRYPLFLRAYADAALQMRRLADLVIACVVLAATLPLALLVALAIKCEGPGPIFERQTCIGRAGRRFQTLNFRPTFVRVRARRVGYRRPGAWGEPK